MNIINTGDFAVTNYNGVTKFSFRVPSLAHIDFVAESRTAQLVRDSKPSKSRPGRSKKKGRRNRRKGKKRR